MRTAAWRCENVCAAFRTLRAPRLAGSGKAVKGLGYKEASHFLRNIGVKGHAILDKHVMRCLAEIGVIDTASHLQPEGNISRLSSN